MQAILNMIPIRTPKYTPGATVRVVQFVRVGHRRWQTQFEGVVEREGRRPVGGIEMGGKASACHQPTLRLRCRDGQITEVALDENTEVEVLAPAAV
ncbi:hypothetical protein VT85_15825 [Planctomyces sp. SH-PL62]|nr:hypothetical protein VT85_15825 [Planctomyces sp. SH-PL62]